jgi:hypothetical protein
MRKSCFITLFAILVLLCTPMVRAQVVVGFGRAVVVVPGTYGPPVCPWGYFANYPYACAPYGYYGAGWFNGGVFIGAGPWYGLGWGGGHRGYGEYVRGSSYGG